MMVCGEMECKTDCIQWVNLSISSVSLIILTIVVIKLWYMKQYLRDVDSQKQASCHELLLLREKSQESTAEKGELVVERDQSDISDSVPFVRRSCYMYNNDRKREYSILVNNNSNNNPNSRAVGNQINFYEKMRYEEMSTNRFRRPTQDEMGYDKLAYGSDSNIYAKYVANVNRCSNISKVGQDYIERKRNAYKHDSENREGNSKVGVFAEVEPRYMKPRQSSSKGDKVQVYQTIKRKPPVPPKPSSVTLICRRSRAYKSCYDDISMI